LLPPLPQCQRLLPIKQQRAGGAGPGTPISDALAHHAGQVDATFRLSPANGCRRAIFALAVFRPGSLASIRAAWKCQLNQTVE